MNRETLIAAVAQAMHECTSHPDYPDYDEAGCSGTPQPAMVNPTTWHHETGMEKGSRGVCWACEPLAATVVDQVLAGPLAALARAEALANDPRWSSAVPTSVLRDALGGVEA